MREKSLTDRLGTGHGRNESSPARYTRLVLAPEGPDPVPLQLTIDGTVLGIATNEDIIAAFAALGPAVPLHRLFVVHSLFGHRCSDFSDVESNSSPRVAASKQGP